MKTFSLLVAVWTVIAAIGGFLLSVARYLFVDGSGYASALAFALAIFVFGLIVNAILYSHRALLRHIEDRQAEHYAQLEQMIAKEEVKGEYGEVGSSAR
jgi:Na+/melibiose symporter-like transporter